MLFFKGMFYVFRMLLNMLVTKREPTPGYNDAYTVGIPQGAYGRRYGQTHCKTKFSLHVGGDFWLRDHFLFLATAGVDAVYWSGKTQEDSRYSFC